MLLLVLLFPNKEEQTACNWKYPKPECNQLINETVAAKTITRAFSEKTYKFSTDLSNIWLSKCSATYLCMRIYLSANIFYQKKTNDERHAWENIPSPTASKIE